MSIRLQYGFVIATSCLVACSEAPRFAEAAQAVGSTSVSTDMASYAAEQPISVTWSGLPGNPQDWIALANAGATAGDVVAFQYVNGQAAGTSEFNGLPSGSYEVRAYQEETFTILAQSPFTVGVGGGSNPAIATDSSLYLINAPVEVTYSGLPGDARDWVAVVAAGSPPDSGFVSFAYTNSQASGAQEFIGLAPGNYEARAYLEDTFTVLASSTFTITTAVVATDLTTYFSGATVTATWAGMPGNQQDWIAIAPAGSPVDSGFVQFIYDNGAANGSQTFDLDPGNYELRAYLENTFTILAKSSFTVASSTLTLDQSLYLAQQPVTVGWTGTPGNATDWIAVAAAGSNASTVVQWVYTNGQTSGSNTFSDLAPGAYEARVYSNNTFTIVATASFVVSGAMLNTDSSSYTSGQTVSVTFSGMPGSATDWIAISEVSASDSTVTAWRYTNGATSGTMQFSDLAPGTYEVRGYLSNTFSVAARSASFDVTP